MLCSSDMIEGLLGSIGSVYSLLILYAFDDWLIITLPLVFIHCYYLNSLSYLSYLLLNNINFNIRQCDWNDSK